MSAVRSKSYSQDHFIKKTIFNLNCSISNERLKSKTACNSVQLFQHQIQVHSWACTGAEFLEIHKSRHF